MQNLLKIFLFVFFLTLFAKEDTLTLKADRAFCGVYLFETRKGTYLCHACQAPLFSSEEKYDAKSGWPAFKKPLDPRGVYYLEDPEFLHIRYVVLCRSCNAHLGHLFHDGPPPKHLRYCIHSSALTLHIESSSG